MGRILTLDVSERNTGWAVVLAGGEQPEELLALGCLSTVAGKIKHSKTLDDIRTAAEIARGLKAIVDRWHPALVIGEMPFGSQSAKSMKAVGICLGVAGSLQVYHDMPCYWGTPQAGKKAMCGRVNASKEAVFEAVVAVWPLVASAEGGEHVADALAALVAARDSDLYRMAVRQPVGEWVTEHMSEGK